MNVTPQLVKLEDGRVGFQIRLGQFCATAPLPEEMATQSAEELKPFFEKIIPGVMQNLVKMQNDEQRKIRKKAAKA